MEGMMLLAQATAIVLSVLIPGVLMYSPLKELMTPFIGLLTLIYLITSFRKDTTEGDESKKRDSVRETISTSCLTAVIFLILFLTGGISSPLFFLLYFLAFALGFLLHPEVVYFYALATTLILFPSIQTGQVLDNVTKLGSLTLFSPLAYFFGRELQERFRAELYHKEVTATPEEITQIKSDVAAIIDNEKNVLKDEDLERLNDILETTESIQESNKRINE